MNQPNLEKIMSNVRSFPSMPATGAKMLSMLQDPEASVDEIEGLLRHDPGLTGNVLKLANSAYLGLPSKVSSVRQAVLLLGLKKLLQLVVASCVSAVMDKPVPGYDLPPSGLWRHSIAVSIAAEALVKDKNIDVDDIFTSALLHDVGKAIDPDDHVTAGLEALGGFVTDRTAWLIAHHMEAHKIRDRTIGARRRRRLSASPWFDDLCLLGDCDRAGRVPGATVDDLDSILDYIENIEEMFGS